MYFSIYTFFIFLDAYGYPITQIAQSVGITDASGNPVTGNS